MAERVETKAKRASHGIAVARGVARPETGDRPTAIEHERDTLKAELESARAQIALFEQQREQFVNRIDWMTDSLHSLLEDER